MPDYIPLHEQPDALTLTAAEDITGGRYVAVAGERTVKHTDAGDTPVGVAGFDAKAGAHLTVWVGGVQRPTAASAIEAGDLVQAAADGLVQTVSEGGAACGLALSSAEAGATPEIQSR